MSSRQFASFSLIAGLVLFNSSLAKSAVLEVSNPSFESPAIGDGTETTTVPNWITLTGSSLTRNPIAGDVKQANASFVTENSNLLATDGSQIMKLGSGTDAYIPLTGYTLAPGQNWNISVDVAWPTDAGSSARIGTLRLTSADNLGNFVAAANHGVFMTGPVLFTTNGWFTLNFNITTLNDASFNSAFNGDTPVIMLRNSATDGFLYFDNLRGTTTATFVAPEPGSLLLMGAVASAMLLRRR